MAVTIDTSFVCPSTEDYADDDHFDLEDGSRSCRSVTASSFVRKLYDMVERESDEIIGWLSDGLCFEVRSGLACIQDMSLSNTIIPPFSPLSLSTGEGPQAPRGGGPPSLLQTLQIPVPRETAQLLCLQGKRYTGSMSHTHIGMC